MNPANPVDNLSLGELKKLFLSDRSRWDTGKAVAPAMLAAGAPERTAFLKIVCGMNDAELSKYFLAGRVQRQVGDAAERSLQRGRVEEFRGRLLPAALAS